MKKRRVEKTAKVEFVRMENRVCFRQLLRHAHRTSSGGGITNEYCRLAEVYGDVLGGPSMLMLRAWH